jgi:hypothetical protein
VTPTFANGRELIRAAREMLDAAGCPAYAVVARAFGNGDDVRLGPLAFASHGSAAHMARTMRDDDPASDVFVVERLQRVGRYRWTVWDLAGENRLHEEFEALPDWL